jgi:hypothetical protein
MRFGRLACVFEGGIMDLFLREAPERRSGLGRIIPWPRSMHAWIGHRLCPFSSAAWWREFDVCIPYAAISANKRQIQKRHKKFIVARGFEEPDD